MAHDSIPTQQVLFPHSQQAVHQLSVQNIIQNPENPSLPISKDISPLFSKTLSINQLIPHDKIQCPLVKNSYHAQTFLQQAQNKRDPNNPTAIITNFNREVGLLVKQTAWVDMQSQELEDIKFLTTTLVQLGQFYSDETNASFLGGIMKAFGWRKACERDKHSGMLPHFQIIILCF
jgi:hypothetical protein